MQAQIGKAGKCSPGRSPASFNASDCCSFRRCWFRPHLSPSCCRVWHPCSPNCACALAESGPRVESSGDNAAPKAASAAEVVEAKFYGDGTWNKAILGAQLGPDRQQVMFVG